MKNSCVQNQTSFQVYNASAGSGKTFTLVKEYLKILLYSDDEYIFQKILAITFTNKAAGEMKERVLKTLLDLSKGDASNDMFQILLKETNLQFETIQKKSKRILRNILQNYSAFHIKTIDSFTNKVIKAFAFDLGLPLDFSIELDTESILEETIDVIISQIGIDKELTNVLVEFAIQKTMEDRSWDVSRELRDISKLLLNENDAYQVKKLENKSISNFKSLEKKLSQKQRETEKQFSDIGKKGLEIIDELGIEYKDFYYGQFPKFFQNLIYNPTKLNYSREKGIGKSIENQLFYTKGKSLEVKQEIESVISSLLELYDKSEKLFQLYYLNYLILKNLIPLAVINSIAKALEEIKSDNNILLISEFNQIISEHLREQPVAFIYEKIGEKYRHYFIDEMQDTSLMQWKNLVPLIDNVLSGENSSLLMVGDAKQAIYRWRGGKAEQFINLSIKGNTKDNNPFQIDKKLENLDTNFRSYSQIIDFNNKFFSHISMYFKNRSYKDLYQIGNNQKTTEKQGGYVQIEFVEQCKNNEERDEIFPEKIVNIIEKLEGKFDKNEICILVRKKSQGIAISNHLTKLGIQILSSETLLLKNNSKVDFIINLLHFLKDKNNGEAKLNIIYFLYCHLGLKVDKHEFIAQFIHLDVSEFYAQLEKIQIFYNSRNFDENPFYESIEEIIRRFRLAPVSDAYIQFFLDFVFDFTQRMSQRKIDFLEYWEQKKEKLSIVASNNSDAVQIMTIHKSKGLEFPVVIYPYDLNIYYQNDPKTWYQITDQESYNNFNSFLVRSSSNIESTGELGKSIFEEQQSESELDNFNLLYVTFTRAKEQLYILSEDKKATEQLKWYSNFFVDFLQDIRVWQEGKLIYKFGSINRISEREGDNVVTEVQNEFISTSWQDHQFNIVSKSSMIWDTQSTDAIEYGNIIHELMANIITEDDTQTNINRIFNQGIISIEQFIPIEELIEKIVHHEELKKYFESDKTVFTERELITMDKQILIPDRLVFNRKNEVSIIDYKTGRRDEKHHDQIENYANVMNSMNYKVLEKILVYIHDEITVVKV